MSGTIPATSEKASAAVAVARSGAELVQTLQREDPALYAQLVGSLSTYSKSAAAPIVGSLLGLVVAHYGLGPYLGTETLNLLTEALVGLGMAAGAAFMHWFGKRPGRALQAAPAAPVETVAQVATGTGTNS